MKDAQRTDHRAVDASEEEGKQKQGYDNANIQRQESWQELNLCKPAKIGVENAGDVKEQKRYSDDGDDGEDDADSSKHGSGSVFVLVKRTIQMLTS